MAELAPGQVIKQAKQVLQPVQAAEPEAVEVQAGQAQEALPVTEAVPAEQVPEEVTQAVEPDQEQVQVQPAAGVELGLQHGLAEDTDLKV